ncbi:aminoglycoside phosphotransferase family protein [Paenibacillus profundus]|uniref:Aminoglycoside phosphotransferase family protein n=1 Tax=Paenibacillus profundus TaxID=1173085 RepID=A0ABS8YSQ5_9BACL|nr:aminoglycoside phosphotransferase family protein [Paenibacillus profundus]MCE5172659.1 aminoglycoside phosphotransferase family protein [Paenibacillus profundus]
MKDLIRNIIWKERCKDFQSLLAQDVPKNIIPMDSGLEADVFRISTTESNFVLKVWNRDSKPDISIQYNLLEGLYNRGIAVSKPCGWGVDENNNQVLLTSFDGTPINKVNKLKLTEIANILTEIHKFPTDILGSRTMPRYDFVDYFFPGLDDQLDIKELLIQLVGSTKMEQNCLIHGDYNLGNILESDGKYTIIDWTNVQLGDPRYDISWSIILIWIYVSERYCSTYRSVFLAMNNYTGDELEKFEAIACLRWILLNRIANLPKRDNTISTVRTILMKNKYLSEELL